MAVETPGFALQNKTYGAEITRRAIYCTLQRGSTIGSVEGGLIAKGDMAVTAGSGMHVVVATGEIIVPGSTSGTQGGYYCRNSSSTELAIATSDPSNPRIDRVSAVVKDEAYAGGENTFSLAVQTGTPTSGATLSNLNGVAAAPASSLTLSYVLVPAGSSSVTNEHIGGAGTGILTFGLYTAQLWPTINYGAETELVMGTEYEPSAVRPAFVALSWSAKEGKEYKAYVNGVRIQELTGPLSGEVGLATGFLVAPTYKWKLTIGPTGTGHVFASTLLL